MTALGAKFKFSKICQTAQTLSSNSTSLCSIPFIFLSLLKTGHGHYGAAYKRKIAIMKSQGNITEALKGLTECLNKFMSDQEAWSELWDLYLSEGEYGRGIYCAEELILHNLHNFFVYQRAGDIRYTMGGIENLKIAFNYYTQALKLNESSLRSLFGLFLAGSSLTAIRMIRRILLNRHLGQQTRYTKGIINMARDQSLWTICWKAQ